MRSARSIYLLLFVSCRSVLILYVRTLLVPPSPWYSLTHFQPDFYHGGSINTFNCWAVRILNPEAIFLRSNQGTRHPKLDTDHVPCVRLVRYSSI